MPSYELGTMIKKLRTQKGISQEELAYPIVSRETLSRIESGKVSPHTKSMKALLERLGYDPTELFQFFLTTDEAETNRIENELFTLTSVIQRNKSEIDVEFSNKIASLIQKLENNKKFMENPLNQQFVLKTKAIYYFYLEDDDNTLQLVYKALNITIPTFDEKKISEYHLTKIDQEMIVTLSLVHRYAKRYAHAIDVLYQLKENEAKSILDVQLRARKLSVTIRALAHVLTLDNRPHEVIDICDEGMKLCHEGKVYLNYRAIAWYKAKALFMLGKTDEYITYARKVYYAFDLYDEINNRDYVRNDVLKDTGVDFYEY